MTGINVHLITPIVCIVCIFYTCVVSDCDSLWSKPTDTDKALYSHKQGGLKAVVWTDVIQTMMMFCAMLLVIIKGTSDIGGVEVLWERAMASGRIEPPE